jgi:hypothetical protein
MSNLTWLALIVLALAAVAYAAKPKKSQRSGPCCEQHRAFSQISEVQYCPAKKR